MGWNWLKQTKAEQQSYREGVSLFFGALLGANLGTLENLKLYDYVFFIFGLAGAVMAFQSIAHARSRRYAFAMIATSMLVLLAAYLLSERLLAGMTMDQINRVFATVGVWLALLLTIELTPTTDIPSASSAEASSKATASNLT
jgi:drug/metabolite transporter (DMT)-like permease